MVVKTTLELDNVVGDGTIGKQYEISGEVCGLRRRVAGFRTLIVPCLRTGLSWLYDGNVIVIPGVDTLPTTRRVVGERQGNQSLV